MASELPATCGSNSAGLFEFDTVTYGPSFNPTLYTTGFDNNSGLVTVSFGGAALNTFTDVDPQNRDIQLERFAKLEPGRPG